MDLDLNISLARRALEEGFLDRPAYDEAMRALTASKDVDPQTFWVRWLSSDQLSFLCAEVTQGSFEGASFDSTMPPGGLSPLSPGIAGLSAARAVGVDLAYETSLASIRLDEQGLWEGRYRPIRMIGIGGTGRVFDCEDTRLGRRVALKIPLAAYAKNTNIVDTLRREAVVTGALEHPAIVPVYDVSDSRDENLFYVMRLVAQPTLEDVINLLVRDPEAGSEYSQGRLLRHFVQLCLAVDFAHARGVVHCDLKPSNILIGEFGEVLVLDWGMAYRPQEEHIRGGGTPGFMPPEQLNPEAKLDARTDVFALGAILYEMLWLTPAFAPEQWDGLMSIARGEAPFPRPSDPRTLGTGQRVPEELVDICMKALELDPASRHRGARELAADIEQFLEGTKERERKLRRAEDLVEEGEQLEEMYQEFVEQRPRMIQELSLLRAHTAPWQGPEEKRTLWDAEDRLAATNAVGARTFQAAVAAFEQALEEVKGHPKARHGLARLYWSELQLARERCDHMSQLFFSELFKQYDDGALTEAWRRQGEVEVICEKGAEVVVAEYDERERRVVPVNERPFGTGPTATSSLGPGSYLATVRHTGGREVYVPLLVRPGVAATVVVDPHTVKELDPWERYVAAGPALLGGDEQSPFGLERVEVEVPSFVIFERHVLVAEYLAFLEGVAREHPERLERLIPMSSTGVPYWRWTGSVFAAAPSWYPEDALRHLPVFGIDYDAAEAYAAWYSARRGRAYRLPREDEWEKAARGVDGRRYPWGEYFDASFCCMAESRPEVARPEAPGSFASDLSPYGVRDTAGGVAEWVGARVAESGQVVVRGGAWCDRRHDCVLNVRRVERNGFRSARVGFRLARSL